MLLDPAPLRTARLSGRLLVAALGVVIALSLVIVLSFGPGRDQGIYAVVAHTVLDGGMPYRDAWDFKPPGVFLVYALARVLFGSAEWGIRAVEVVGLAAMALGMVKLADRWWAEWRIGLLAAAFALLTHAQLDFWHTAQPESFGGMLIIGGLVAGTHPSVERPSPGRLARARAIAWLVLAGLLFGCAGLLKPPLAGAGAVFGVWAGLRRAHSAGDRVESGQGRGPKVVAWLRAALPVPLAVLAGGALPFALCLGWFAWRGALGDLWATLFVFTPHYTAIGWTGTSLLTLSYYALAEWLVDYSGLMLVGLVALVASIGAGSRPRGGALLSCVVAIQLLGVALQAKFFPYHYGAIWPVTALLAALGWWWLGARAMAHGRLAQGAVAIVLVLAAAARTATKDLRTSFWGRLEERIAVHLVGPRTQERVDALASVADVDTAANRAVADRLRARVGPDRTVYVWGFEPIVYELAGRRCTSRYVYNVPQRVAWAAGPARALLLAELRADPPAAIVVAHNDVFPMVTGDAQDSSASLDGFGELRTLIEERYELGERIQDFDVYFER